MTMYDSPFHPAVGQVDTEVDALQEKINTYAEVTDLRKGIQEIIMMRYQELYADYDSLNNESSEKLIRIGTYLELVAMNRREDCEGMLINA